MKELPKFYNNLDLTLQEIEYLLNRGVKDRKSSFHYTMLCTINNKTPESRTVILRNFNKDKFELNIHSDSRSGKITQIESNNNVSCLFYDDKKKIQIRINGLAKIEKSYQPSWDKLTPNDEESIEGLKNFAVIKVIIDSVEWLYLASQGHRRAIFKIKRKSLPFSIDKKWLIP